MAIITGNPNFPTPSQVPDNSILDVNGKQAYLGNQWVATVGVVTLADTAEHPILSATNPANNTKSLFKALRSLNVADDSGAVIVYRVYANPTGLSAGSAITPQNCRLASTNTTNATLKKAPTVSGNGTLLSVIVVGFNAQNIDSNLFILDPGQTILITAQATTACVTTAESVWYEI